MDRREQHKQDGTSDEMKVAAALGEPRLSDEEREALRRRTSAIDETVALCVRQILPVLKQASTLGKLLCYVLSIESLESSTCEMTSQT